MRRRNSAAVSLTVEDLLALCQSEGLDALASKIRRDTTYAAKAVTLINTIFAAAAAKKAEAEAAAAREAAEAARVSVPAAPATVEGELTDSRAWAMLADLVTPSVLPDLTDEERSALRAAFMEESRKAA